MTEITASRHKRFEASGARKTMLSIIFILLLPFFISLPAMLFSRISHGLWSDTAGLAVLAVAFAAVMAILAVQLMFAIRARVVIGDKAVALTMPQGRSATPALRYKSHVIPYDNIRSVDSRCEVYGAPLAPVLLRGARIVTKDDEKVSLGYVNDHDADTFPLMTIAGEIAERAGIAVKDHGAVRRSVRKKALGETHSADEAVPLTKQEMDAANSQHRKVVVGVVAVLGALVAAGITMDLLS